MLYEQKTFTLPTTTRRMTDREYEIAVGLREPSGVRHFGHIHGKTGFNSGCPRCMEEYGKTYKKAGE